MGNEKLKKISPYAAGLLAAVFLYFLTNQFGYTARPGQIGPDFWPKAVLVLAMVTCLYEIVKNLFFAAGTRKGTGRGASAPGKTATEKSYPGLLLLGMAMTAAYLFLIEIVGFLFCTFLYLLAFMYLGRYRNLKVIVWSSGIGTLVFAVIFLKFVYISLPMGREPFSSATFFILRLLGIK